jgi:hypothetical protein
MNTELRWGMVVGVLTFLWFLLEKVSGFDSEFIEYHNTVGMFYLIPFFLIYFLALVQIKRENGGRLGFMNGVKSALRIALYSLPFIVIATLIKIYALSPDFQENMIQFIVTTGKEEEAARKAFSTVPLLLMTCVYGMTGVVAGALAMIFIKKD